LQPLKLSKLSDGRFLATRLFIFIIFHNLPHMHCLIGFVAGIAADNLIERSHRCLRIWHW